MEYYHDKEKQTVYAVEEPDIKKMKKWNSDQWFVSTTIHITRSDNYLLKNHQYRYDVRSTKYDYYDVAKDSKEDSLAFFRASQYPHCQEIDKETYEALKKQYEENIRNNKPPS